MNKNTPIPITDGLLRKSIYEAFDGRCFYTGRYLEFEEMHIDHIVPKSKGGKDCISNYVLCCSYINKLKSDKTDYNFQNVVLGIVDLVFVDKVLKNYSSFNINKEILNDYQLIKHAVSEHPVLRKNSAYRWSFSRYMAQNKKYKALKLKPIRSNGKRAKRNDLYYLKKDIEEAINFWVSKNNLK